MAPQHRGRGHGLRLWRAGLEHLAGRTVGLDGVVAQQANYRRSGFAYAWPNFRFGGKVEGRPTATCATRATSPSPMWHGSIAACFQHPGRHSWPHGWPPRRAGPWRSSRTGGCTGLGTIRRCRAGCKVGPLYAPDATSAERILRALAATAPGEEIYLDVPGPNLAAMRLAQALGLTQRFETARMYQGPAPVLPLERIFGITTFELG